MASIKCGNCKSHHETVVDVRACYDNKTLAASTARPAAAAATAQPTTAFHQTWFDVTGQPTSVAKDTQTSYIRDLAGKREVPVAGRTSEEARNIRTIECVLGDKTISKSEASAAIDYLKTLPARNTAGAPATAHAPYPQVPQGHYAVASRTGNNDLDFFRVDRPTDGIWAGRTFVKRIIGGRPDVAVRGYQARQALEAILAAGVKESALRYGQEVGRCSRCNRHLTDETSRQYGMGPECRSK